MLHFYIAVSTIFHIVFIPFSLLTLFPLTQIKCVFPSLTASGLQLYIGRDGTAALGGLSLKSGGEYKPVVFDKR